MKSKMFGKRVAFFKGKRATAVGALQSRYYIAVRGDISNHPTFEDWLTLTEAKRLRSCLDSAIKAWEERLEKEKTAKEKA